MVVIEAVASEPEVQISDAVKISKHSQHHSDSQTRRRSDGGRGQAEGEGFQERLRHLLKVRDLAS